MIDLAQGADQETDVAERESRTRNPFLARHGRVRRNPFCAASRGHPVGGHRVRAPKAVLEQLDLGRDVQPGERRGLLAKTTDDAVEVLLESGRLFVENPGGNRAYRRTERFLIGDHGRVIAPGPGGGHAGHAASLARGRQSGEQMGKTGNRSRRGS